MKKIDKDGLLLCELQATAFENSIDKMESSSEIFIRRFMRSKIAKRLDNESVLESNIQANDILQLVDAWKNKNTGPAGCQSNAEDRADVWCAFHGRDRKDSVAGEEGTSVQSQCRLSYGRADGCRTDLTGKRDESGLHGGGIHKHDLRA